MFSLLTFDRAVSDSPRPPMSRLNPRLSSIETTDAEWTSTDYEIRYVVSTEDGGTSEVVRLTDNDVDDLSPAITSDPTSGNTWIVWWRDGATDTVLVRKRNAETGIWSPEQILSSPGENSRSPSTAFDGNVAWVAYELDAGSGTLGIAVRQIEDDPAPFGSRTLIAGVSASGSRDVLIQSAQGRLWVSWIDSQLRVGWSRYQSGAWTSPAYESYAADSVSAARSRIRALVTGS
jgi:hypothetical protein